MAEYRQDRVTAITEQVMREIRSHLKEEPPPQGNHHYSRISPVVAAMRARQSASQSGETMTPPDSEMIAELKLKLRIMTPGEVTYTASNGAQFGYIATKESILWGVPHDNYSPEPTRTINNTIADRDARAIVLLRNYASRLIELAEKGMEKSS